MKTLVLAASVSLAASSAFAGSMAPTVMEPEIIVEETAAMGGGIVVPLLVLAVVAAIVASSD